MWVVRNLISYWEDNRTIDEYVAALPRKRQNGEPAKPARDRAACGTLSGSSLHYRYGEVECHLCREARREYRRNRKGV